MNIIKAVLVLSFVAIIGGGIFLFSKSSNTAMMEKSDGAMMQKEEQAMEKNEGEAMGQKTEGDAMMEKKDESAMMNTGSYEPYAPEKLALAESGDVVLFFRASWCPTCRALDANIRANLKAIPANVTILDVNYDTEKDLKKKYGVTYQHTMVQVDATGNQITKWSGSPTLAAFLSNIK